MKITEEYREMNRKLHEDNAHYGAGDQTAKWYPYIAQFAQLLGANSILDYGAGKNRMATAISVVMVIPYDPAIPGLDETPDPHDMVACLDVLEHIEPECLDEVLDDLQRCTIKAIFLTVSMVPARKVLADGRNAHLIQKPVDWWIPKLMARWDMKNFADGGHEFSFFGLAKRQSQTQKAAA